ncbi:MAG: type II 3-dehydroquinate dehydratase [Pseudomonadota bacterium]|nr:type II 3-dehydroquinate dehydratase [Pseudomonadota bacterium]
MSDILVINGPNLNLLGTREPDVYGTQSLSDIENKLKKIASPSQLEFLQSNAEHEIIDAIQVAKKNGIKFIIINPGPLTHTSIALRDTFLSTQIPFIEVHISNIFKREEFRKKSFLSDISHGLITGLGAKGYEYALIEAISNIQD